MSPQQQLDVDLAQATASGKTFTEADIQAAATALGYTGDLSAEYRYYASDYTPATGGTATADLETLNKQFDMLVEGLIDGVGAIRNGDETGGWRTIATYLEAISPASPTPPSPTSAPMPAPPPTPTPSPTPTPTPEDTAAADILAAVIPNYHEQSQATQTEQHRLMLAWIAAEGGLSHNNPMNVTAPLNKTWTYPGETGFWNDLGDGMGVVNFDNLADGAAANAKVLQQANMAPILAALTAANAGAFVEAFPGSWGTNPTTLKNILHI